MSRKGAGWKRAPERQLTRRAVTSSWDHRGLVWPRPMQENNKEFFPRQTVEAGTNRWDWALLPLVLAALVLVGFGASQMARPYQVGEALPLSLDPWHLPYYLLRTTLR